MSPPAPSNDRDPGSTMASGSGGEAEASHSGRERDAGSEPELERAEVFGDEVDDLHLGLWHAFESTAKAHPEREAIVSLWQPCQPSWPGASDEATMASDERGALRWTYRGLHGRALILAEALGKSACRPGMRLAAVLWNSAEWGLLFWAALKAGMTFVPIDPTVPQAARDMVASIRPHVIVVQDADAAEALDLTEAQLSQPCIRLHCSDHDVQGWTRLHHFSQADLSEPDAQTDEAPFSEQGGDHANGSQDANDRVALIVFTSGTTGKPKGCPHTVRNLISQSSDFDPDPDPSIVLRWLVHTPVSHIFAVNNMLRAWRYGGAVIFPSKAFDVSATLRGLVEEQCAIMSATPTLVKALLAHPAFPSPDKLSIRLVTIGGTTIGPDDIRLCRESLGARDAIQAYGMSEGAPVISWRRPDPCLVDGYHPGVGKALPGSSARICRPGSREVLRRGEVGELHIGGPSVIDKYVDGGSDEALYTDDGGNWLATGDQAKIDKDGIVHILGRYKDLIIRGGENIYPLKIEAKLAEMAGLQPQVVSAPDALAGQVPVAVVKLPKGTTKLHVLERARLLGPRYTLDAVYTLEELGFQAFPMTSLGKVKKEKLRQAVAQLRKANEPPTIQAAHSWEPAQEKPKPLVESLLDIWEQLSGTRPSKDESVVYLADSITLLRYCDSVLRALGKRIYLQDFSEYDSVEKQAQLLAIRDHKQASLGIISGPAMSSGFMGQMLKSSTQDVGAGGLGGSSLRPDGRMISAPEIQIWKSAEEVLTSIGLKDSVIEDTMPIRESLWRMLKGRRPQSYHNRMVFRIRDIEGAAIRRGLERGLATRPLLRAIACYSSDEKPYHAVVAASQALFDQLIHEFVVGSEDEAATLTKDDSEAGHSRPFMFQADLVKVQSTGDHHLSLTYNHSAIDAMSLMPWHHDLDRLVQDAEAELPALTPYKFFADLYSQYADSAPAKQCVDFHVKKLRGISRFKRALWPRQRAPGWMISNDAGSPDAAERQAARERIWQGRWASRAAELQYPRCGRVVCLPQLAVLRRRLGVDAALFARGALAVFNVLQTGASQALFNTWESGRAWPFVPRWMHALLPPPMSIDGPTVQWLLTMTEVDGEEPLPAFWARLLHERDDMTAHQHAPWDHVVRALTDEGPVAVDASFRQSFVWDVSMGLSLAGHDFVAMHPVARYDWADCGLFWNAFMIDSDNLYFIASWDTAQMNDVEVEGYCDSLAAVMRKLADDENWDKTVGDVFFA